MKVVSKLYEEEQKCANCNWSSLALFAFEGDNIDEAGLSGWCLSEMLANGEFRIIEDGSTPPERRKWLGCANVMKQYAKATGMRCYVRNARN